MKKFARFGVIILIFAILIFLPKSVYAENKMVKIECEEKSFYNMLVEQLEGNFILGKNDVKNTIEMSEEQIKQVKELSFDASSLVLEEDTSIKGIENFKTLEKLELQSYPLENLANLKDLKNLKELTINNCYVSDIKDIEGLKKLNNLDLANNKIADISALKKLTQLTKLNLKSNQISNIEPLAKLNNLTGIDLSSNHIRDIKALGNLSNLACTDKNYDIEILPISLVKLINFEYVYLDDNQISDISPLNEKILNYTSARKQKFLIKTNKKEIDTKNTVLQNQKLQLVNCELKNDKIAINDIEKDARYVVVDGTLKGSTVTAKYDSVETSLMVSYSETQPTTNPVTVTISSSEEIRPLEGWTLSQNRIKLTKTYTKNAKEKVKVYDLAGNATEIEVNVKNIDIPILNTTYSIIENISVSKGEEIIKEADKYVGNPYVLQGNSLTDGIDCSHFVHRILQICGLYDGKYIRSTNWINVGEPVEDLDHAIAGDVIVWDGHVGFYDGKGKIVEAKGTKWGITHDRDAARAIKKETYMGIRRFTGKEKIETAINPNETTNQDVKVTINSNKQIKNVKGWNLSSDKKTLTKTYSQNTKETVKVQDLKGNEVETKINITNINK